MMRMRQPCSATERRGRCERGRKSAPKKDTRESKKRNHRPHLSKAIWSFLSTGRYWTDV